MGFNNFETIYLNKEDRLKDEINCLYLICKHCGKRVERGIINVSAHWNDCEERLKKLRNESS